MNLRMTLGLTLVAVVTTSLGCGVAGFATGAIIDARRPDEIALTPAQVLALDPGRSVEVALRDGRTLSGGYLGPVTESGDAYGPAFARSRQDLLPDYQIPRLGSRVTIDTKRAYLPSQPTRELRGVDQQSVYLKTGSGAETVSWANLQVLGSYQGAAIDGRILADLTATGQVPTVHGISLQDGDIHTPVLFVDVLEFRAPPLRNAKWRGLTIGVTADALALVVIYSATHIQVW